MLTVDIHKYKASVKNALEELDVYIGLARKDKDRLLSVIVGYGSTGGTHKIKTGVLDKLEEYKNKGFIKDYILGSELDLFSPKYLSFKYKERIPTSEKRECNPGKVYIVL